MTYFELSQKNSKKFKEVCDVDPVSCLELVDIAKEGTLILDKNKDRFRVFPYFNKVFNNILVSNYNARDNDAWTNASLLNLFPSRKEISPNQELANKLAVAISDGKVLLTKKSADLLYQLNTDSTLKVSYNPSSIKVNKGDETVISKIPSRVSYSDWNNWSVFGSVLINRREDGTYYIYDDKYDYDIRGNYISKPENIIRDIQTKLGSPKGNGVPFLFEFDRDKEVLYEEK